MSASPPQGLSKNTFKLVTAYCHAQGWYEVWNVTAIFYLITGVVVNAALIWLFLRERKSLSASQVLGVNIIVMDFMSLSMTPVRLIHKLYLVGKNHSDLNPQDPVDLATDAFSMFNLIGCPLLLTCMCIERYLAVRRPVLYLKVRKWEYRMAACAVVWAITLTFCVASGSTAPVGRPVVSKQKSAQIGKVLMDDMLLVCISITISCLFIIMLACLGGVVQSLLQQSPAHRTHGNRQRSESPQKRQAVANVLVVVLPAVIAYLPVLVLLPLVLYIYHHHKIWNRELCAVFEVSHLFPMLGVLIGPLFYFSKAKQMCCLAGTGKTTHTEL